MLVLTFSLTLLLSMLTASSASSQEDSSEAEIEFRQLCPNGRCIYGVPPPAIYNPYRPKQKIKGRGRAYGYPLRPRSRYPLYRRSQLSEDLPVQARSVEDLDLEDHLDGYTGGLRK